MKQIFIEIVDGLIDVRNIPEEVEVIIRNYDVKGIVKNTSVDNDGMPCYETLWKSR